jgi:hypothetical protein
MTRRSTFILRVAIVVSCLLAPGAARAQMSGECTDAYEFLVKTKEQLFPGHLSETDLKALQHQAKSRTTQCGDLGELWQVRKDLAERLHDTADLGVVKARASKNFVEKVYPPRGSFNPSAGVGKRWALLAGTDTFAHKSDLHVGDLEYAEADVKLLAQTFTSTLGFADVDTLIGDRFTLDGWRAAFARLRDKVNEDDLVVVYLVSHGRPTKEDRNDTSFILTHSSQGPETWQIYASSIQLIDLVQDLSRELRAQRVIIMLDACFSGDAISGQRDYTGRPAPYLLEAVTRGSGRAIVAAARANQVSTESTSLKQGTFAYCFAKAATPTATIGEIFASIERCVPEKLKPLGLEQNQAPQLFVSEGARTIVLGTGK